MIQEAQNLAPVGGIFSSYVKSDSKTKEFDLMSNQNLMSPELVATKYLDQLTRKLCPYLQYFVVFTNISYKHGPKLNSTVEQIIELRHKKGLPAKVIQWNTVDNDEDESNYEIIQYKKISLHLDNMDYLMTINKPIVTSTIDIENVKETCKESLLEAVMRILSIKDIKSISLHSSLAELGLNSLTAVEMRQTLDRDYNVILSPMDLASITISFLEKLVNK